jgi:hypothetical protein
MGTEITAMEYAIGKWDWKIKIKANKVGGTLENGDDLVTSKEMVKNQVAAVVNALNALDPSVVKDTMVQFTTAPVVEPLE